MTGHRAGRLGAVEPPGDHVGKPRTGRSRANWIQSSSRYMRSSLSPREAVEVVALQNGTHGEEVLDRDALLARVGMSAPAAYPGRTATRGHPRQSRKPLIDGDAHQHARDRLGGRARVAQAISPRIVEIGFIDKAPMAREGDAGDLDEGSRPDGALHRLQALRSHPNRIRRRGEPAVLRVLWGGG